jgi:transposase
VRRAPEVGFNGVVLYPELQALGFSGGLLQVQRFVRPYRDQCRWSELATIRYETGPGEQAQVDYGQLWIWIGAQLEKVHLFVFTLGYSRRLFARAYRNERLTTLLDGHERAFRWFGGVTLGCLYDNPRTLVLGRRENKLLWHPLFEDFARYYAFIPRACQPYRARTKGKAESGVKYVKRNTLMGRRFASGDELNDGLERWSAEVADLRIHGTTHERPIDRFAQEQLTPLGTRPPYHYQPERTRRVANDALVTVGAARYSVPVEYVGQTVSVHEGVGHYEFFQHQRLIARHQKPRATAS